jgi:single-strand DNA-binding protein
MSNVITVVGGGLGRDAEFKTTGNGTNVCIINVADKVYNGKDNATQWYRVALFGMSPDKYPGEKLRKGARVDLTGELCLSEWKDKDGIAHTTLELRNARIISVFLRDDDGGQPRASNNKPGASTGGGFHDNSVPF